MIQTLANNIAENPENEKKKEFGKLIIRNENLTPIEHMKINIHK